MSRSLKNALYLLIFFNVFNFTSALMGGGYVIGTLGGSNEISTYGVTFFGLGNALAFPLGDHLRKRFGGLRVLFYAIILFCIAMYLCGSSSTFFLFNVARFFCGVTSAVFFPISWGFISEHTTDEQRSTVFAFFGFLVAVTPVLGASFGGWVAYDLDWPWIFYSQIPILAIIGYVVYNNEILDAPPEKLPFDTTGCVFYVLSISSVVTAVCLGQQLDWFRSPFICFLLVFSLICFVFFILWEWNHKDPFLDLKLFKIPIFTISSICLFCLFSAYFGMVILLSLWLHIDANYSPLWISLLIAHMLIAGGILFFVMKKWFQKVISLWVVLLAIAFFALSCFYSTAFNAEIDFFRLALARIFAGFGLAFFYFPLFLVCIKSLSKDQLSHGVSLFQSVRLIAGSVGCIAYPTMWIRRRVFYHERLGEQLTVYSEPTNQFLSDIAFYGPTGLESKELLSRALEIQSDALALADCFYLMGWIMVGVFVLILVYLLLQMLKKKQAQIA